MAKERVLFICINNSFRSQMAEGFFRSFYGEYYDVYSAGSDPKEVDSLAVQVMAEIDIDISKHTSNSLKDFEGQEFDYVITVCGNQYNACPFFIGGKKYFKQPFKDPSTLVGTGTEKMKIIMEIRDEIGDWIQDLHNYQICDHDIEKSGERNCCDLGEMADDCCCPLDSAKNKDSSCK
jgi:arsenate reductase